MKSISIDSNSILDMSTKKPMSEIIDFSKEYVTTETDKDTIYKAGDGINISSDNTISIDQGDSAGVEPADSTTAGIMKLYGETGANTDGTMTQESITDELDNKAPTDSPEFTGTPTAPTPDSSDEGSDRLATTAYVLSLLKDNPGIIDEILTAINGKLDATTAANTYLTKTAAGSTYLTQTTANSTYLTQTTANNTYLTKSSAESTYAKKSEVPATSEIANRAFAATNLSTLNITDLNDVVFDGGVFYSSSTLSNYPSGITGWIWLVSFKGIGGANLAQLAWNTAGSMLFFRMRASSGWQAWHKIQFAS